MLKRQYSFSLLYREPCSPNQRLLTGSEQIRRWSAFKKKKTAVVNDINSSFRTQEPDVAFKRLIGYVEQQDVLLATLTPRYGDACGLC